MPTQPQLQDPPPRPRLLLHSVGLAALIANKIRRTFRPYDRPRPWSAANVERSVSYVLDVVRNWESGFRAAGVEDWIRGRHVLELGPGPDLGTGLTLLARGAASYVAVDRFPLAANAPESFYERLFARLAEETDFPHAVEAYRSFRDRPGEGALRYLVPRGGTIRRPSDLVPRNLWLSQAAFEHVPDPEALIRALTPWCADEALALHHVDAATHTPWIREADPLNILRYPNGLYRALSFPGSPNRWRSGRYISAFDAAGWNLLDRQPIHRLSSRAVATVRSGLDRSFRALPEDEIAIFSFRLILKRRSR